jgi:hypothetical protein
MVVKEVCVFTVFEDHSQHDTRTNRIMNRGKKHYVRRYLEMEVIELRNEAEVRVDENLN